VTSTGHPAGRSTGGGIQNFHYELETQRHPHHAQQSHDRLGGLWHKSPIASLTSTNTRPTTRTTATQHDQPGGGLWHSSPRNTSRFTPTPDQAPILHLLHLARATTCHVAPLGASLPRLPIGPWLRHRQRTRGPHTHNTHVDMKETARPAAGSRGEPRRSQEDGAHRRQPAIDCAAHARRQELPRPQGLRAADGDTAWAITAFSSRPRP